MQRLCTTALAALLITASLADAQVRRTSTDLSREDVLPTMSTSAPLIPVGSLQSFPSNIPPSNLPDWLECNGQPIPPGAKYDRLRSMVGPNVPDYTNGQFLRSTTDAGRVGTTVADSIRSHTVQVPGQAATVSGTAAPHGYDWVRTGDDVAATMTSAPNSTVGVGNYNNTYNAMHGMTSGGTISGIAAVQPTTGTYSGSSETAPIHSYVRTYIRAVQ